MTQSMQMKRAGAPGSAYVALMLGLIAIATLPIPPIPIVAGIAGLVAAVRARGELRRDNASLGTVPSLLGAIFSVIGILTGTPWFVGVAFLVFSAF